MNEVLDMNESEIYMEWGLWEYGGYITIDPWHEEGKIAVLREVTKRGSVPQNGSS